MLQLCKNNHLFIDNQFYIGDEWLQQLQTSWESMPVYKGPVIIYEQGDRSEIIFYEIALNRDSKLKGNWKEQIIFH